MRVTGIVERGLGMAGPQLGAPTANLRLAVRPPLVRGVYAALAVLPGEVAARPAVVCYGADAAQEKFEVHVIDWQGDLVGRALTVEVREKLHEMLPWESVEQMRAIVADDVREARALSQART